MHRRLDIRYCIYEQVTLAGRVTSPVARSQENETPDHRSTRETMLCEPYENEHLAVGVILEFGDPGIDYVVVPVYTIVEDET